MVQSGMPFDITTGTDRFGTTLFNSRPGIASAWRPGVVATECGLHDPNPIAGKPILPRNHGCGPGADLGEPAGRQDHRRGPRTGESAAKTCSAPGIDAAAMSAPGCCGVSLPHPRPLAATAR